MSSTSPASTSARTVLYRHMCCEPDMKVMTSPLCARRRCTSATCRDSRAALERTRGGRPADSLCGRGGRRVSKSRASALRRHRVNDRSSRGSREQLTGWRLPSDLLRHGIHRRGILVRLDELNVAFQAQRMR